MSDLELALYYDLRRGVYGYLSEPIIQYSVDYSYVRWAQVGVQSARDAMDRMQEYAQTQGCALDKRERSLRAKELELALKEEIWERKMRKEGGCSERAGGSFAPRLPDEVGDSDEDLSGRGDDLSGRGDDGFSLVGEEDDGVLSCT